MSNPSRFAAFLSLLMLAGAASAHDLFVILAKDSPGKPMERAVVIKNGTFHESAGAFPRDRVRDAAMHHRGQKSPVDLSSWNVAGNESRLHVHPPAQGTFLLGVSTMTSSSTRTAAEFADYLKLEDLPDVLATYDASKYPRGVTYSYSKHARAIGQSGKTLTDDYAVSLGFPLEIRLQRNPATLKVGERVTFQVLHQGAPAPGLRVLVGSDAHVPKTGQHDAETVVRTDARGEGAFQVTNAGTWYIHTNRMVPSSQRGADFVSDRASLTFAVRPRR